MIPTEQETVKSCPVIGLFISKFSARPKERNYKYRQLDAKSQEIRLLVLQPGSSNDPIRCTLKRVSIAGTHQPDYEATSYVWGDASLRSSIFIDGCRMSVPASSARVLQRARLAGRSRALWIDAICINQQDIAERSQQVGIMSQIYAKSRRNLIWLGEDDGTSKSAIASIRLIVQDLARTTGADLDDALFDSHNNFKHAPTTSNLECDRYALLAFFSSEWFSRLWIVQEVALAPQSICLRGECEVPFVDVLRSIAWFTLNFRTQLWFSRSQLIELPRLESLLRLVGPGRVYTFQQIHNLKAIHILETMRFYKATDPKDYVYGTLGILEKFAGNIPKGLEPD
jgi:hypothetical protein